MVEDFFAFRLKEEKVGVSALISDSSSEILACNDPNFRPNLKILSKQIYNLTSFKINAPENSVT